MKLKKLINTIKANKYMLFLSILAILFIASVIRYGLRSFAYPIWDEQHYMAIAAEAYRQLQHPSLDTYYNILQVVPYRQPGYPFFILPFLLLTGLSHTYFWGIVTNGFMHIASMFGIYFIARSYMSKQSSFLAAFLFLFYGWPLYFVHLTYSETATSTLCVWAIFFLIKSDYFQKRNYSLLFGLLFGLAILTKWIAVVYLAGPLFYVLYHMIRKRLLLKRTVIIHAVIAFAITFLVSFYPYYVNSYAVVNNFVSHRVGGEVWQTLPDYKKDQFSFFALTYYASTFEKLGILFFILLLTGLILAFHKKSKVKLILWAVLGSWTFFTFFSILKDERFIIPIYPYLAILSALVFETLKNGAFKTGLITLTVLVSFGTFLGTVWGKGPMKQSLLVFPGNQSINIHLTSISRPPDIYKKSGGEIVDFIKTDSKESRIEKPRVLVLFYVQQVDEPIMSRNLYHQEKPLYLNNYLGTGIQSTEKDAEGLINEVFNYDYIVTKTGNRTEIIFAKINYKVMIALNELFDNHVKLSDYFEKKTDIYIFQDSSTVTVYKKKRQLGNEEREKLTKELIKILR